MLDGITRRRIALPERGVELAILDWGGDGPPVLLHHATGFCAALWDSVARELHGSYRVLAVDGRGHGDSTKPEGPKNYHWIEFIRDFVTLASELDHQLGLGPFALAAGSSFGGTVAALASAIAPERFKRIAMLDPVVLPPPERRTALGLPQLPAISGPDMADRTLRRRAIWGSRDEIRAGYANKAMFRNWTPNAFETYIQECFGDREDGSVVLKCPPAVEASTFQGGNTLDPFDLAPQVQAPTLIAHAIHGQFPLDTMQELARAMPQGRCIQVEGGHLLPMEDPKLSAKLLLDHTRGAL